MLSALSAAGSDFLIVGAHALAAHGHPRATGDLDLWLRPTPENALKVCKALIESGAPLHEIRREDFETSGVVFQIGLPPGRVDLMTSISGIEFDAACPRKSIWSSRV
jgi:hypothetical protein